MQSRIRGLTSFTLLLALASLAGVACNPKVRVPSESDAVETLMTDTDPPVTPPDTEGAVPTGPEPGPGEAPPDVADLEPGSVVDDQSVAVSCEIDAGACSPLGDAGVGPACVPTGPRDCSSDLDNDCDGQPDNVVDAVCVCAVGSAEPCEEHPDLDGQGPCRAGLRTCVLGADGLTSEWGACAGSVGPGGPDSCTVKGDDADCDGTPNTDCPCVDGDTQECGSTTDTGPCAIGTSTCSGGRFGACISATPPAAQDSCAPGDDSNCNGRANDRFCSCLDGATQECGVTGTGACELGTRTCVNGSFGQCVGNVDPRGRDCRSQQDNDCDGRADNARDNVCTCSIGATQACQTHPGQDGIGRCQAGTQICVGGANNASSNFNACTGSVGPRARDCSSAQDNDCNGSPDNTRDNVCTCSIGATQACQTHPGLDGIGRCQAGRQTCVAGAGNSSSSFGQCTGSQGPIARDCRSAQDSDCDGRPDNTIDGVCECIPGQGNGPCSSDASNSRCSAQGQCVPCQADADCSLVSGGRNTCDGGECVGPRPFECSSAAAPVGDQATVAIGGLTPPRPTGGAIANGRYTMTQITFYGSSLPNPVPGEVIDFRDGSYRRNRTFYSALTDLVVEGFTEAGTYAASANGVLRIEGVTCSRGNAPRSEVWEFSANGARLEISSVPGISAVQSYERTEIPE